MVSFLDELVEVGKPKRSLQDAKPTRNAFKHPCQLADLSR
jgi:hypothetical protein